MCVSVCVCMRKRGPYKGPARRNSSLVSGDACVEGGEQETGNARGHKMAAGGLHCKVFQRRAEDRRVSVGDCLSVSRKQHSPRTR